MKKSLQKGFSLVELLVVVAIIGVLAGVGIVGYQSYTESAKEKVAEANFNSIARFIETELTLLNNGVQDKSGALMSTTTEAFARADATHGTVLKLKTSIETHFGMSSDGLKFKNPFATGTTAQLKKITGNGTGAVADYVKGAVILRQSQNAENGITSAAGVAGDSDVVGKLTLVYVGAAQASVPAVSALTAANKFKLKSLTLK